VERRDVIAANELKAVDRAATVLDTQRTGLIVCTGHRRVRSGCRPIEGMAGDVDFVIQSVEV